MDPSDWIVFGSNIIVDGNGWQPWKDAFNVAPVFGAVSIGFSIYQFTHGNPTAGWVQLAIGVGMMIFGMAL